MIFKACDLQTWSSSVGMKAMALQVAATLIRLQYTVYLTGVFSSIPWKRLLKLEKANEQMIKTGIKLKLMLF